MPNTILTPKNHCTGGPDGAESQPDNGRACP